MLHNKSRGLRLQTSHVSFLASQSLQRLLHLLPCLFSAELLFLQNAQLPLGPVILLVCILSFLLSCSSFCCTAGMARMGMGGQYIVSEAVSCMVYNMAQRVRM